MARTPARFTFNVKAFAWLTQHAAAPDRLPDWLRNRLPDEMRGKRSAHAGDVGEREMELVWQLHREALAPLAAPASSAPRSSSSALVRLVPDDNASTCVRARAAPGWRGGGVPRRRLVEDGSCCC